MKFDTHITQTRRIDNLPLSEHSMPQFLEAGTAVKVASNTIQLRIPAPKFVLMLTKKYHRSVFDETCVSIEN